MNSIARTNAQRFYALYVEELTKAVRRHPSDFALLADESPESYAERVADKMVRAVIAGHAVIVSDTMQRVAKKLGVGTKMAEIYNFIRS